MDKLKPEISEPVSASMRPHAIPDLQVAVCLLATTSSMLAHSTQASQAVAGHRKLKKQSNRRKKPPPQRSPATRQRIWNGALVPAPAVTTSTGAVQRR